MSIPVGDLGCGWFENVIFCVDDTPLINCVKLLRNRAIPAVPIINSEGKVSISSYPGCAAYLQAFCFVILALVYSGKIFKKIKILKTYSDS